MPFAVVTGGSQGLGKAIAERFLKEGFSVAICARNTGELKKAEQEWNEQYPAASIIAFTADLSKGEDVQAFATHILANFETVDVLVNNAGTYFPGSFAEEPEGQLEELMKVNLYSAYHITRALLPVMKKGRSGHIFNMCSVASHRGYAGGGAYSITKYALLGFSDNLRLELMPENIKVTSISPGATYTRSWQASEHPETRFMQPKDVADMVWAAYNLSPSANVESIVMKPIQGDI